MGIAKAVTAAVIALAALTGCAGGLVLQHPEPAMLPEPYASRIPDVPPPPTAREIMLVTPEMREFLYANLDTHQTRSNQIRSLSALVLHPGLLGIDYDGRKTRTAAETFHYRTGNCLSLSILFVAMARELGIDARFQEVEIAPQWDRRGDIVFSARHVNVLGRLRTNRQYVMDFYPYEARHEIREQVVTDAEAMAQYYNNLGGEYLASGDYAAAYVYFVTAARTAPSLSYVWSNLGVLYLRVDYLRQAEYMFRHASRLDPSNSSAVNNLVALLQKSGRDVEAERLISRLRRAQQKNPYYYYVLARREAELGNHREALEYLDQAIRLKPEESLFYRSAADVASQLSEDELAEAYELSGAALETRPPRRSRPLRF